MIMNYHDISCARRFGTRGAIPDANSEFQESLGINLDLTWRIW